MKKSWNWTKNDGQNALSNLQSAAQNLPSSAFGTFANFYQDIDRMFDAAFRNFGLPSAAGGAFPGVMFTPKIDISSTDREYTIEVEVPGMEQKDIRLDVTREGELCICGEKRLENDRQEKDFHRVERSYGSFSRTLQLPEDVELEEIEAEFRKGVLTITAPRTEDQSSGSRRIEVKSGEEQSGEETSGEEAPREEERQEKRSRQERSSEGRQPERQEKPSEGREGREGSREGRQDNAPAGPKRVA